MHGEGRVRGEEGCAWQGVWPCVAGNMRDRGHAWHGAWVQERWPLKRAVHILLEYILVFRELARTSVIHNTVDRTRLRGPVAGPVISRHVTAIS